MNTTSAINVPNRSKRGLPQNLPYGYIPNSPPNDSNSVARPFPGVYDPAMQVPIQIGNNHAVIVNGSPMDDSGLQFLGSYPTYEKRRRITGSNNEWEFAMPGKQQIANQQVIPLTPQTPVGSSGNMEFFPLAGYTQQQLPPSPPLGKPLEVQLRKVVDYGDLPNCDYSCYDEPKTGHYVVKPGEMFTERYSINKLLGQGTFGKVVECFDHVTNRKVAIKIIKAIPKYREASKIELRVLSMLAQHDSLREQKCVQLRDCFDYRNHVCLVTDLLDISVFDFLNGNGFAAFPGNHVQDFARQILVAVKFIHDLGLVHTDLKPENILLHSSSSYNSSYRRRPGASVKPRKLLQNTKITLIDFGSAIFNDEYHPSVVSTRHYRAPEIILNTGWSHPCDIWSIGCVLVELVTGRVLFETRNNLEHLHLIERITQRKFPDYLCRAAVGLQNGEDLVRGGELVPMAETPVLAKQHGLRELIFNQNCNFNYDSEFWTLFAHLIDKMLVIDPQKRITAAEALNHPWFDAVFSNRYL